MKLIEKYNSMSWVLLEYEIIYFNGPDFINTIDAAWLELRTIPDEEYDKKLLVFKEIAKKIEMNSERPIGSDLSRPSVQLIIEKMRKPPLSSNSIPTLWPDDNTETDIEHYYRCFYNDWKKDAG